MNDENCGAESDGDVRKQLAAAQAKIAELERIRTHIHYPECWDTAAYPTLEGAVCEISRCDPDQCTHHKEVAG